VVRRAKQLVPTFRPRRADDDPFILELGREAFARWSHDPARTIASMLSGPRARTVVGESAGERIGFAVVDLEPLGKPYGPWRSPKIARLDAIAVTSAARRRGLGTALLDTAEDIARSAGGVVMTLMTAVDNRAARRLFQSAGYFPLFAIERSYSNGDSAIEMFKAIAIDD
jgi:ribosomal protein S18 acetylase RimI-like enzyme